MKKIICISVACMAIGIAGHAQAGAFQLKGKITGQTNGKVLLYYSVAGKPVKDSAMVTNGAFTFKGNLTEPCNAYFEGNVKSRSMDDPNSTSFYIEPAEMTITLPVNDFKHAVITGSKTAEESAALEKSKEPIYKAMEPLNAAYSKANKDYMDAMKAKKPETTLDSLKEKAAAIHDKFDPFREQASAADFRFFATHPNSYVTAFQLRFYTGSLPLDTLQMYYNNMNSQVQQSSSGKELAKEIDKRKSGAPGAVAKNFTAKDIHGVQLSLVDFKGKPVLIDFWASWCIPCRHSNPHLKELYTKYHDKGFDIIGVSDDDGHEDDWRKAVAKDGIDIWHHVLRGLDWDKVNKGEVNDKDISDKFGIHSLPTKILIDKNGVIAGRYDQGTDEEQAQMDKKIEELLAAQ